MPKISVVMPMHNGLPYVEEAINSIINQTYTNWELLVINDASTDGSPDVVKNLAARDARIRLIDNDTGVRGSGPARNCGIEHATGEYVMMMDADDISMPRRMERQVEYMDKHPDVALTGCHVQSFGASNRTIWLPRHNWIIKALMCFYYEPWGATIMFRKSMVKERYIGASISDDTLFNTSISWRCRVANIPAKLYHYRVHSASITKITTDMYPYKERTFSELLPMRMGFVPTPEQVETHLSFCYIMKRGEKRRSKRDQLKWLGTVLLRGRYKWYERMVLGIFIFLRINYSVIWKPLKKLGTWRSTPIYEMADLGLENKA